MSLLVVQLPDRPRLHPQGRTAAAPAQELGWVLSPDGRTVQSEGRCAAALLPQAGTPATYGDGRGARAGQPGVARIYKSAG